MRKLKLDVEKLEVTSFTTAGQRGARGTVEGHLNQERVSDLYTCAGLIDSCAVTCASGCGPSCATLCGSYSD